MTPNRKHDPRACACQACQLQSAVLMQQTDPPERAAFLRECANIASLPCRARELLQEMVTQWPLALTAPITGSVDAALTSLACGLQRFFAGEETATRLTEVAAVAWCELELIASKRGGNNAH
jgi:hypothetical protein